MPVESELAEVQAAFERKDVATLWERSRSEERDVRKAAKRALYLLRAQGLQTDAPPDTSPHRETLADALSDDGESCRISAPDAAGEQLIFLPRKESKGYRLFQAMISDSEGVTAFEDVAVSRRRLHQIVADLERHGLQARPVPRSQAIQLLAQAIRLAPERPAALKAASALAPMDPVTKEAPTADDSAALAESARLFESPALRGYLPEMGVLRETLTRLQAIEVSPLHLSDLQRRDQLKLTMDRAIEGYFDARQRARYARRLRALGSWFLAGGEREQAERAFAAAAQLDSSESPLLNPFARRLFEGAFALPETPPAQSDAAAPSTPLIIAPGSIR